MTETEKDLREFSLLLHREGILDMEVWRVKQELSEEELENLAHIMLHSGDIVYDLQLWTEGVLELRRERLKAKK